MTNKFFRVLLGVLATAALASPASANLLSNASFEDPSTSPGVEYFGAPGWTEFGGVAFTINNDVIGPADAHDGVQALKTFGNGGVYQQFAASAGQTWEGSAWALNDTADQMAGGQVAAVNIEWIAADGSFIDAVLGSAIDASTTVDVWQLLTASGVAPAGTAFARLVLITGDFAPGGTGGAPRFDDASFNVVPIPGAILLLGSGLFGLMGFRRKRA